MVISLYLSFADRCQSKAVGQNNQEPLAQYILLLCDGYKYETCFIAKIVVKPHF